MNLKTKEKLTLLSCIAALIVSILTIGDKLHYLFSSMSYHFHPGAMASVLNILILTLFLFYLKPHKIEFKPKPGARANAGRTKAMMGQYTRVNNYVEKICDYLNSYILLLIVFYAINLLKDLMPETMASINRPFPLVDFLEISSNAISGAYIYLSFVILYKPNPNLNGVNSIYSVAGMPLVIMILFSYLFCLLLFPEYEREQVTSIVKLVCGLYNGLAMGMFFGCIGAIELHFRESNDYHDHYWKKVYQYGIAFILPLYVLMQPLYVTFVIPYLAHYTEVLKFSVFSICFIGKGFLLLFIMDFIRNRWLHSFLLAGGGGL